jgi:hypothetical protein
VIGGDGARGPDGRFSAGNQAARGRRQPHRDAFAAALSEADLAKVARRLLELSLGEDAMVSVAASKTLLRHLVGMPRPSGDDVDDRTGEELVREEFL